MKKFIKKNNRKGFTLVETLLAIFILIVVSTMLINGFIATMAYSYQTSVYSKSAGTNYKACMNQVGVWSHYQNKGADGRESHGYNYMTGAHNTTLNNHTLEFKGSTTNSFESLYVAVEKNSGLGYTVPGTLSYNSDQYAPKANAYADNRTTFLYYPEYCADDDGNHVGEIVVMYKQSSNEYYWVIDNGSKNLAGATRVSNTAIHST